ncbi:uncharacterized protein METZ01_LOCUS52107 [marine metagenome]|uniref:DUF2203 domain-containing protein n=1 Tax=marine metagenome TaxID=408172 RepID=A0A381SDP2_9ZZZZ
MANIVRHLPAQVDSLKTDSPADASPFPEETHELELDQMMESDQFTLDEANALVPWLEEMFRKQELIRQEYVTLQKRLSELAKDHGSEDETAKIKANAELLARHIEEAVEDILDRGIIVRDVATGLIDFPSQREGREVYLCWICGEERIDFWHETNRGFSHRKRL